MQNFNYHRPGSVEDAAKTLAGASDGTLMGGGMTLLPTIKQRLASPSDVVDLGDKSAAALNRIYEAARELSGISQDALEKYQENFDADQSEDSPSD